MIFHVPIYCPQCRALYPSGLALDATSSVLLGANNVFGCPRGHRSSIPEGLISVRDGVVLLTNSEGTEPVLEKIRKLAADAVAGKTGVDEAVTAISALAPNLAEILQSTKGGGGLTALLVLLWFIIEMTKALHPNAPGAAPTSIKVEPRTTIINKVAVDEGIAPAAEAGPTHSRVERNDQKHSKRKARRLRGKAKVVPNS